MPETWAQVMDTTGIRIWPTRTLLGRWGGLGVRSGSLVGVWARGGLADGLGEGWVLGRVPYWGAPGDIWVGYRVGWA